MQPGKRNRRITLQTYTTITDEEGYQKKDWVDTKTVWANFRTYNNKEKVLSNTTHEKQTCEVNIRYMNGVDSAQRIRHNNQYYNVLSVSNVNEQNKEIILLCEVMSDVSIV